MYGGGGASWLRFRAATRPERGKTFHAAFVIDLMTVVSVTRLRVRSARFLLPFLWQAVRSALQAKRSRGNLGVRLRKTRGLAFWT